LVFKRYVINVIQNGILGRKREPRGIL